MEISRESSGDLVTLRLAGRLDANWCNHVEAALTATVRGGDHRLQLDMAGVSYMSSAGLRVLLAFYKQLRSIHGLFGVIHPSDAVRSVLELSGLGMLIASAHSPVVTAEDAGRAHRSAHAHYQVFTIGTGGIRLETVGDPGVLRRGIVTPPDRVHRFDDHCVALGVGALGTNPVEGAPRCGEFLAVAGAAAFQPGGGSSRPDFMVSQGALVPEGLLVLGLYGQGSFSSLVRFEATSEARTLGLGELAREALELSGSPAAVLVAITETAGLIGATLRQSPTPDAGTAGNRFGFPQIRDWLSFTSERAYRDSTSLVVGVIASPGAALGGWLRPLDRGTGLLGHLHAAAFPYRPLRKGRISLKSSVAGLFEGQSLQAVMHLLADPREFNGAGESEFFRGAVWIAPLIS